MKVSHGEKWRRRLPTLGTLEPGAVFRTADDTDVYLRTDVAASTPSAGSVVTSTLSVINLCSGRAYLLSPSVPVIVYPDAEVILHSGETSQVEA